MNQKRITLIYEQLDLGGRQIALLALAEALQDRGWQVEILSFLHGELEEKFTRRGISVQVFPVRPKIRRILELRQHLLRNPPMVVHTHLFSAGFWGRIAAKLAGVPVIIHTEGGMPFEEKRWKRVPAEHFLTTLSDAVICVAQAIKDHLIDAGGLAAESLLVIPNGVAADNLLQLPIRAISDRPVVFSAGRLAKVKGYDLLIRAMAGLDDVAGKLLLAGDGPEADPLKRLSDILGVSDRIEFLGYREDVQQLLAQSDLYVTPSRSEGMSNSILEAMAAGVPVVATDVGGNRELLGDTGRIVRPEDPAALAAAITSAVKDPETTMELARNARHRVESIYTLDHVVAAHEELYYRCLDSKGINVK